jgi:hypothetical protein
LITIPAVSAASAVAYDRFVCLSTWSKNRLTFGSLALREHFLHHLWGRFLCFAQFDYSRCHSVLLTEVRCLYVVTARRECHGVDQRGVKLEIGVQHGPRYASYIPLSLLSFQTQRRGDGSARRFTGAPPTRRRVHRETRLPFPWSAHADNRSGGASRKRYPTP